MESNVLWQGLAYNSLENCLISSNDSGFNISSTIIGRYERLIYFVSYTIRTNHLWETILVDIIVRHSNETSHITLDSDGKGQWFSAGKHLSEYDGCTEPDISVTPFTNTLPVNRIKPTASPSEIKVLYFDIFQFKIYATRQRYAYKSRHTYHYENVPNDFEADIIFNESGIVMEYPSLFHCLEITNSHYGNHGS